MLEGLEAVELSSRYYLEDNFDFRLDAEYFTKINIALLNKLLKVGVLRIADFSYVTDGIHTSIDYCENSNINLFSATTPRENFFDLSRQVFISEKAHASNPRTALMENDIIISTVGTIGNCAVVNKSVLPANSDRHVGIIRIKENVVMPRYLSTFLLSKYGRFQTWRESTGNVQLNLFLYRIRTLKVPKATLIFQNTIENLVILADKNRAFSQDKYSQAENLLLETLGMADFSPSAEKVNIKSFKDSFAATSRLDAEYYQPKYEDVITQIQSQPHACLAELVSITKSIEPGSDAYSDDDNGLPFLRVADYSKLGLQTTQKKLSVRFVAENKAQLTALMPKANTILFSKDGSVGEAYCLRADADFVTSSAILHLQVLDNTKILSNYLTLALNSTLVRMQAERDAGGSIILHWRVSEIENVIIPLVDFETQTKIAALVQQSFSLKAESERLLEAAKRAVEIAIETNEDAALAWLASIH